MIIVFRLGNNNSEVPGIDTSVIRIWLKSGTLLGWYRFCGGAVTSLGIYWELSPYITRSIIIQL